MLEQRARCLLNMAAKGRSPPLCELANKADSIKKFKLARELRLKSPNGGHKTAADLCLVRPPTIIKNCNTKISGTVLRPAAALIRPRFQFGFCVPRGSDRRSGPFSPAPGRRVSKHRAINALYFSWSVILQTPALAQFSSPSMDEPLTPIAPIAPIAPIVSLPTFIGMPPLSQMTSAAERWGGDVGGPRLARRAREGARR